MELFFSAVRTKGGSNDNPTARQFKAIFKRLLMRHQIKNNNGNCSDSTSFLHVNGQDASSMHLVRKYNLENADPEPNEHDYDALPVVEQISEYKVLTF